MPDERKYYSGVLLYDKPVGITSHDAVAQVRKIVGMRRAGHTGTLDPAAQGLLMICLGPATKICQFLTTMDKTYEAEICFGRTSSTYDSEGVNQDLPPLTAPRMSDVEFTELLKTFEGKSQQRVPAYSAVRVNGQRLYEAARRGEEVEAPVREINIKSIQFLGYDEPYLRIVITCSKGTYIRSFAHDLGQHLQCGAYLSNLTRTAIGHLNLKNAMSYDEVLQAHEQNNLEDSLLLFDDVLDYSGIRVSDEFREYVITGRDARHSDIVQVDGTFGAGDNIFLKDSQGQVLAVGSAEVDSDQVTIAEKQKLFTYIRVLN